MGTLSETILTGGVAALTGAGGVGLWFRSMIKKIVDKKIEEAARDAADLIKLELPDIAELKKQAGDLVARGITVLNTKLEEVDAKAKAATKADRKVRPSAGADFIDKSGTKR